MRYFRTEVFLRSFQSLPDDRKNRVAKAMEKLESLFIQGSRPIGLGLKQLRHGVWEIRAGLSDRILFRREGDTLQFLYFPKKF